MVTCHVKMDHDFSFLWLFRPSWCFSCLFPLTPNIQTHFMLPKPADTPWRPLHSQYWNLAMPKVWPFRFHTCDILEPPSTLWPKHMHHRGWEEGKKGRSTPSLQELFTVTQELQWQGLLKYKRGIGQSESQNSGDSHYFFWSSHICINLWLFKTSWKVI